MTSNNKYPLTIILDNIRSAYNVGSIIRTSACANIKKVITCGYTPEASHHKVSKTALGGTSMIKTEHYQNIHKLLKLLKKKNYHIFIIEISENSQSLWNTKFQHSNTAIIFGNEVKGIQKNILDKYHFPIIKIPMPGEKSSLNVASATAITIYEIIRQWEKV